jgi:hypothetical protein
MGDQEERQPVAGDLGAVRRDVVDEPGEPGRAEVAQTLGGDHRPAVAAVVVGMDEEAGRVQRPREAVVAGPVLGEPVRDLDHADRLADRLGPGVGGQLGRVGR